MPPLSLALQTCTFLPQCTRLRGDTLRLIEDCFSWGLHSHERMGSPAPSHGAEQLRAAAKRRKRGVPTHVKFSGKGLFIEDANLHNIVRRPTRICQRTLQNRGWLGRDPRKAAVQALSATTGNVQCINILSAAIARGISIDTRILLYRLPRFAFLLQKSRCWATYASITYGLKWRPSPTPRMIQTSWAGVVDQKPHGPTRLSDAYPSFRDC